MAFVAPGPRAPRRRRPGGTGAPGRRRLNTPTPHPIKWQWQSAEVGHATHSGPPSVRRLAHPAGRRPALNANLLRPASQRGLLLVGGLLPIQVAHSALESVTHNLHRGGGEGRGGRVSSR